MGLARSAKIKIIMTVTYLFQAKKYREKSREQEYGTKKIRQRIWVLLQPFNTPKQARIVGSWIRSHASKKGTYYDADIGAHRQ